MKIPRYQDNLDTAQGVGEAFFRRTSNLVGTHKSDLISFSYLGFNYQAEAYLVNEAKRSYAIFKFYREGKSTSVIYREDSRGWFGQTVSSNLAEIEEINTRWVVKEDPEYDPYDNREAKNFANFIFRLVQENLNTDGTDNFNFKPIDQNDSELKELKQGFYLEEM